MTPEGTIDHSNKNRDNILDAPIRARNPENVLLMYLAKVSNK